MSPATRTTKKKPSPARKAARKSAPRPAARKTAARKYGKRADLGKPTGGFYARQPPQLRAVLEELRGMIEEAAPDAGSSLKWGMPFYTLGGKMMCALGGHSAHVNLILAGPPGTYADPRGLLTGGGKTGRHLKLTRPEDLPRREVRAWLRTAAETARKG